MRRQWRPDADLVRLSSALADEILAAHEQELRDLSAVSGRSLAAAARDVRRLIAAATDDQFGVVVAEGPQQHTPCVRQH